MAITEYFEYIKKKGKYLSDINPGSDEIALDANEALKAIELLKNNKIPILGGDILSTKSGKLIYAYQLWGSEYHCLNWFSDKLEEENQADYVVRSYENAKEAINKAIEISQKMAKDCFIVLTI